MYTEGRVASAAFGSAQCYHFAHEHQVWSVLVHHLGARCLSSATSFLSSVPAKGAQSVSAALS